MIKIMSLCKGKVTLVKIALSVLRCPFTTLPSLLGQ
jgi:hypothetical protein